MLELLLLSMFVELVLLETDNEDHVSSHIRSRHLQNQRFPPRCRWSISCLHQTSTPNLRRQLLLRSLIERVASAAAAAASSLMELLLFLELRSLIELLLVSCLQVDLLVRAESTAEVRH